MDQHRQPNLPSRIQIGSYEVGTWYSGCYPLEYARHDKALLICEFCLSYMFDVECLAKHNFKCRQVCPAGNEIYRCKHIVNQKEIQLSVFEVDGYKAKQYSQNLCFIGKLFIDQKTLCYDVDQFLFYVLTKNDEVGFHILGYFSKEKHSKYKHNVSCILILPQFQGYGYGNFLIEFSYLLSKCENQLGSPERPLSTLGYASYMKYWKFAILDVIIDKNQVSLIEISKATNMTIDDVKDALIHNNLARKIDGGIQIYLSKEDLDKMRRPRLRVNAEQLRWTRFISHYSVADVASDNDNQSISSDSTELMESAESPEIPESYQVCLKALEPTRPLVDGY